MSYFKALLFVPAILVPGAASALAADAIRPQAPAPVPVVDVAPQDSWAGGYTGLYLGGAANKFKTGSGSLKNNNAKFGAYAGWNFQNDKIVYGVEGDVGYNNAKKTKDGLTAKSGFDGSLRGRVGYDLGTFLPYVTAGVAGTQVRYSNDTDSAKKFRVGWTAGAGVETILAPNVTARVEYRYSDFGKKNVTLGDTSLGSTKLQSHDVRLGVAYKF